MLPIVILFEPSIRSLFILKIMPFFAFDDRESDLIDL